MSGFLLHVLQAWPQEMFETVPVEERRPMRVLCLFADIGPGKCV